MANESEQQTPATGYLKTQDGQYRFRFDNGVVADIHHISSFLLAQVTKSMEKTKPQPPVQQLDRGDGQIIKEVNTGDPDYIAALNEWNEAVDELSNRVTLLEGVEVEVDHQAVQDFRAKMAQYGVELDPNDKWVYLTNILGTTNKQLKGLFDAVLDRSEPSKEMIAAAISTF